MGAKVQEPQPKETDTTTTPPGSPKIAPAEINVSNQGPEAQFGSRPAVMESAHQVVDGDAVATIREPPRPTSSSQIDEWQPPGKFTHFLFNFSKFSY